MKSLHPAVFIIIYVILIALVGLLMTNCSMVEYKSYNPTTGTPVEEYSMNTFLKSVEDVTVIRSPDVFGLQIGRTNTDTDVITDIAKILEYYANPVN